MMRIKFNANPGMPVFNGPLGNWKANEVKEVDEHIAKRLLGLYQSPFTCEDGAEDQKSIQPTSNKMMPGAPENKSADTIIAEAVGIIEPEKTAVEEAPKPEAPSDPQPIQNPGESNTQFKKRTKEWQDRQSK